MLLCELSTVKTMLDIPSATTTSDAKLTILIEAVSALIARAVGYQIKRATITDEVHAINNRQYIQLNSCPIQSVTSVTINDEAITDFSIVPNMAQLGFLYRGTGWTGAYYTRGMTYDPVAGERSIKVTYVSGWYLPGDVDYTKDADDSLPLDIQNAVMQAVIEKYRVNVREAEGVKSHTEGGISDTYNTGSSGVSVFAGLSDTVYSMIQPYIKVGVA